MTRGGRRAIGVGDCDPAVPHEAPEPPMSTPKRSYFPHERLDAYQVALELARKVRVHMRQLPPGYGSLRNQLERASAAVPPLIAEGASRRSWRDKRHRFTLAQGECAECAAALDLIGALGLIDKAIVTECRGLASRVGAMLARLIQRND